MTISIAGTTASSDQAPVKVLILGGSYGGLAAAMNLADLCAGKPSRFGLQNPQPGSKVPLDITIIDERDGYYHLIGSPLALADEQYADGAWVKFADIKALRHPQFRLRHGSVTCVNLEAKTALFVPHLARAPESLEYDYLVAATGLRRTWPSVPQSLTKAQYLDEVQSHIEKVGKARHGVAVIGGGAVGIEMAAELKLVRPGVQVTLIHSRDRLLSNEPLPDDFKDQTLELVHEAGVETIMGKRVQKAAEDESSGKKTLNLSDGSDLAISEVINAVSTPQPTTSYLPSSALSPTGEIPVNSNLTFATSTPHNTHHFAIGDLIPQPGVKRCGGAMHHGHYAAYNIHQHILSTRGVLSDEGPKYQELADFGANIGLAVGKQAIGYSKQTGIMRGEETLGYLFGDDLGFKYCWDYLKLGEETRDEDESGVDEVVEEKVLVVESVIELAEERGVPVAAEA